MASFLGRTDFGNLLEKNLNVVFVEAWKKGLPKMEWTGHFEKVMADGHEYRVQKLPGFGPMPMMPEGTPFIMETASQGYVENATIEDFGLGFAIHDNLIDDQRYRSITETYTKALAKSARDTQNKNAADVLNFAYSTDAEHQFADGQPLISNANKSKAGNWSNVLATPADWSELVNEQMAIQIEDVKDDAGLHSDLMLDCIIIPLQRKFDVERTLRSTLRSGTDWNDPNAFRNLYGDVPVKVMRKLSHPNRIFWKTDEMNGLSFVERKKLKPGMEKIWETRNKAYTLHGRWKFACFAKRGVFGNGAR